MAVKFKRFIFAGMLILFLYVALPVQAAVLRPPGNTWWGTISQVQFLPVPMQGGVAGQVKPVTVQKTETEEAAEEKPSCGLAAFAPGEGEKGRFLAHTGRCGKAAQSSALAFRLAGEAGYWGIETDLRWSKDHALVCFHDESLDAHTDGNGMIEDCTWEYLTTISVNAGNVQETGPQPITSFSDYLDICKEFGVRPIIDIKYCSLGYKGMLDAAYEMVKEKDMLDSAIWQCSLGDYLTYVKELDENNHCWLLCGENISDSPELVEHAKKDLGCEGINVPVIDPRIVSLAHEKDMVCAYYITDKPEKQEKCFEAGFDLVMEDGYN